MHIAEQGEGDPIVLCHGFPGLWYSWRHQLSALSAAGYRVIAPTCAVTDAPTCPPILASTTAGTPSTTWSACSTRSASSRRCSRATTSARKLVWDLPNWAPGRVRALMQLSVPRMPRSPVRPTDGFRYMSSQHFVHLHYFQEYGPADRELGDHPREFLSKIFHALSGANRYLDCWDFPSEGNGYLDVLPEPPALPWPWLSEDEFGYYVDEFTRTGFTGGLNWYRADDYVWEQNEELHGRPVTVPTMFIAGAKDPVLEMMGENPFETMAAMVPGLRSTHVIPDVGHFVQMEAADQVNTAMLEFLRGLD